MFIIEKTELMLKSGATVNIVVSKHTQNIELNVSLSIVELWKSEPIKRAKSQCANFSSISMKKEENSNFLYQIK